MKTKRILAFIAVMVLSLSSAACSSSSGGNVEAPSDISTGSTAGEDSGESKQSEPTKEEKATISETVLVDEAGVKITAKSLDDSFLGSAVKLLIENDSGKDLTFQCRNASVNGYMIETMMSVDVVNGKKANDEITFMSSDLKMCNISAIADMEFSFHIFTTEGWETFLDTPQIQLRTSISDDYEYSFDDSGNLVYDGNNIKVVVKGLAEGSSIFGPSIIVYIENSSDKNITVQARDVSINGFMVDAIFSADAAIGKRAVDDITFMSSELEENEIISIENVELSFHIFDTDSWDTIVDTDVITITF